MSKYSNLNNYKYYKVTKKSGCISPQYNFTNDKEETLIILDDIDEISGNYHNN